MNESTIEQPPVSLWTALRRGLGRRCPRCGRAPIFARWFTLERHCGHCDLELERNPGDTWALWLIGDRVFIALLIIVVFLLVRSDSPWFALAVTVATVVPLVWTMPHRMGVCIAVDFLVRDRWGDLARRSEDTLPIEPGPVDGRAAER